MTSDIGGLIATSAAAAWLTKTVVDLIRLKATGLDGNWVLALALVLGLATNVAWTLYRGEPFAGLPDYGRVAIQGVLAFAGAVATTEAQTAAKRAVARKTRR